MQIFMKHQAGFVSIIGKPNAGKSTLMNALVGEKISIISPKVQTTRHRIMGILSKPEFQIVFSDTPGIIEPKYKLHSSMMEFVNQSLQDADVVLFITDVLDERPEDEFIYDRLKLIQLPLFVILNKIDLLGNNEAVVTATEKIQQKLPDAKIFPMSALNKFGIDELMNQLVPLLPEGPSFYPDD